MESSIWKQAARFLQNQKKHKRWLAVFLCLAVVVAVGTVTALKYTGTAMVHTLKVLDCPYTVHAHTQECYTEVAGEKMLSCGYADYVVHTHNDDCRDSAGRLICKLPEVVAHTHSSRCYTQQKVLVCGQEEASGHVHSGACYAAEQGNLTCRQEEHTHGEGCYDEAGNLICAAEEHAHSDDCYAWNQVLTCTESEGSGGHTHTDACYETQTVLSCGKLETHTHDEKACYDAHGTLTCEIPVLEEHVHSADCFKVVEMTAEEIKAMNDAAQADAQVSQQSGVFFTDVDAEQEDSSEEAIVDSTDESVVVDTPEYCWLSDSGKDYTVTVAFEEGSLPENAELAVAEIAAGTAEYDEYYQQMVETMLKDSEAETEEELGLSQPRFFDIAFLADGKEVEPDRPVYVDISYQTSNGGRENKRGVAVHFKDNGDTETLITQPNENGYRFMGKSFSVYGFADAWGGIMPLQELTCTVAYYEDMQAVEKETVWKEITHSASEPDSEYNCTIQLTNEVPTRDGYVFSGWRNVDDYSGTIYKSGAACKVAYWNIWQGYSQRFYAVWEEGKAYTVNLNVLHNGESQEVSNVGAIDGKNLAQTLESAWLKTGVQASSCTWYSDRECTQKADLTAEVNGNLELYTKCYEVSLTLEKAGKTGKVYVYEDRQPIQSDFVVDGTVYCGYTYFIWKDGKPTEETLTAEEIISGNRVITEDVEAKSDAEPKSLVSYDVNTNNVNMKHCTPPSVEGEAIYVDTVSEIDSYRMLRPEPEYYTDLQDKVEGNLYEFTGWQIKGTKTVLKTEEELRNALKEQASGTGLELEAKWDGVSANDTVAFYLFMDLKTIQENKSTENKIVTSTQNYTNVLALRKIAQKPTGTVDTNDGKKPGMGTGQYSDVDDQDTKIRAEGKNGYIVDFPSNEEILAAVRDQIGETIAGTNGKYSVRLQDADGKSIQESEITEKNFTVKWYVYKEQNAWHIDGMLVPTEGHLNVTKTFYGDKDAIDEVTKQRGYSITIKKKGEKNPVKTLTLDQEGVKKEGNTYTWTLDLPKYATYTIEENNYQCNKDGIAVLPEYMISNADEKNKSWTSYSQAVEVTVDSYADGTDPSVYQTVSFLNSYIPTNSIAIHKVGELGHALGNVEFTLQKKVDGDWENCDIYKDGNGKLYIVKGVDHTTSDGAAFRVDDAGNILLHGLDDKSAAGEYQLVETTPVGYVQAEPIGFTISEKGDIGKVTGNASIEGRDGAYSLRIVNYSDPVSVTVTKDWGAEKKLPVKMQLYRNGVEVEAEASLSAENDWTYTWGNLPKYVGSELATYTVRETWIDSTAYSLSADPTDGYAGYIVVISPPSYSRDQTRSVETLETADNIAYTVTNRRDTGELVLQKVDQYDNGLTGAKFELRAVSAVTQDDGTPVLDETGKPVTRVGETVVKEAVSENGMVNFGEVQAGTYQLTETEAPPGYHLSQEVYTVTVTATSHSMVDAEGNPVYKIINEANTVPLPESGGAGTTLYTFGGIAIFAMGLMYGRSRMRRRERRGA